METAEGNIYVARTDFFGTFNNFDNSGVRTSRKDREVPAVVSRTSDCSRRSLGRLSSPICPVELNPWIDLDRAIDDRHLRS